MMVKKVGSMMGLSAEQAGMAFEVFNFAILAIFVGWLLARTLPKAFRNRSGVIQQQLVDARSATEQAGARLSSVEARLAKLDDQIAAMRAQAEKDSELDEQRIKASVEDEKKKIMASAEQEIAAATSMARRQLQQYAADLAISQAAQKLVVPAETDRLLVQAFDLDAHVDAKFGVEVRERLIKQEHLRLPHERTAHGNTLRFCAPAKITSADSAELSAFPAR